MPHLPLILVVAERSAPALGVSRPGINDIATRLSHVTSGLLSTGTSWAASSVSGPSAPPPLLTAVASARGILGGAFAYHDCVATNELPCNPAPSPYSGGSSLAVTDDSPVRSAAANIAAQTPQASLLVQCNAAVALGVQYGLVAAADVVIALSTQAGSPWQRAVTRAVTNSVHRRRHIADDTARFPCQLVHIAADESADVFSKRMLQAEDVVLRQISSYRPLSSGPPSRHHRPVVGLRSGGTPGSRAQLQMLCLTSWPSGATLVRVLSGTVAVGDSVCFMNQQAARGSVTSITAFPDRGDGCLRSASAGATVVVEARESVNGQTLKPGNFSLGGHAAPDLVPLPLNMLRLYLPPSDVAQTNGNGEQTSIQALLELGPSSLSMRVFSVYTDTGKSNFSVIGARKHERPGEWELLLLAHPVSTRNTVAASLEWFDGASTTASTPLLSPPRSSPLSSRFEGTVGGATSSDDGHHHYCVIGIDDELNLTCEAQIHGVWHRGQLLKHLSRHCVEFLKSAVPGPSDHPSTKSMATVGKPTVGAITMMPLTDAAPMQVAVPTDNRRPQFPEVSSPTGFLSAMNADTGAQRWSAQCSWRYRNSGWERTMGEWVCETIGNYVDWFVDFVEGIPCIAAGGGSQQSGGSPPKSSVHMGPATDWWPPLTGGPPPPPVPLSLRCKALLFGVYGEVFGDVSTMLSHDGPEGRVALTGGVFDAVGSCAAPMSALAMASRFADVATMEALLASHVGPIYAARQHRNQRIVGVPLATAVVAPSSTTMDAKPDLAGLNMPSSDRLLFDNRPDARQFLMGDGPASSGGATRLHATAEGAFIKRRCIELLRGVAHSPQRLQIAWRWIAKVHGRFVSQPTSAGGGVGNHSGVSIAAFSEVVQCEMLAAAQLIVPALHIVESKSMCQPTGEANSGTSALSQICEALRSSLPVIRSASTQATVARSATLHGPGLRESAEHPIVASLLFHSGWWNPMPMSNSLSNIVPLPPVFHELRTRWLVDLSPTTRNVSMDKIRLRYLLSHRAAIEGQRRRHDVSLGNSCLCKPLRRMPIDRIVSSPSIVSLLLHFIA